MRVPGLHIGGWYDIFLSGTIETWRTLVSAGIPDQELLIGPWAHNPWGAAVGERRLDTKAFGTGMIDRRQVEFFKQHLDPDVARAAPARDADPTAVVDAKMQSSPNRPRIRYFQLFADDWSSADSWPPQGAAERSLYLHSGGSANSAGGDGVLASRVPGSNPPDIYEYRPTSPVLAVGGHSCCFPDLAPMGMADQTRVEQLAQVLVYTSEPLDRDLVLAGPVRAELWVASDGPSADYVARLCLADECGSWNLTEGITRVAPGKSASGLTEPRLVEVSLRHIAARIDAGRRLRLHVTGGAFPMWDLNPQTGARPESTAPSDGRSAIHFVYHDPERPSRIVLTILEPRPSEMTTVNG